MASVKGRPDFELIHRNRSYIYDIPYPRLFYSAQDIPEIRKLAQNFNILERLVQKADGYLSAGPLPSDNLHTAMGEGMSRLADLSAAYTFTGGARYAEGTLRELEETFGLDQWIYPVHQPMEFDHGSANVSAAVAIAIDRLGGFISDIEISELKKRLIEKAVETFRRVYANRSEHWVTSPFNWRSMICSDIGMALLVVMEEYPRFEEAMGYALSGILEVLDGAPPDGEWGEGPGYWAAAAGLPLRFAIPLERMTGGKLSLFQHPYFDKTGDFLMHCTGPNGRVFAFADCGPSLGSRHYALLGLLARKLGKPHWAKLSLEHEPEDLFELACRLGTEDPGELPDPPLSRHFKTYDLITLRSGWEKDDTFVALKAGPTVVGHSHLDINTFMVTALGETMIPDLGTWPYAHKLGFFDRESRRWDFDANSSLGHNVILVDRQGQKFGKEHYGKIVKFQPGKDIDLAISDGTKVYSPLLESYRRWFLFIKPDLLVILDDIKSSEPRYVEWLLHYEGELQEGSSDAKIVKGEAAFDLNFLLPSREEGWVSNLTVRKSSYEDSNRFEMVTRENRYLAFSSLHPYPEQKFLAIFSFHGSDKPESEIPCSKLLRSDDREISFNITHDGGTMECSLQLDTMEAVVRAI